MFNVIAVLFFQGDSSGSDKKKTESTSSYNYRVVKEVCFVTYFLSFLCCLPCKNTLCSIHIQIRVSQYDTYSNIFQNCPRKSFQIFLKTMTYNSI